MHEEGLLGWKGWMEVVTSNGRGGKEIVSKWKWWIEDEKWLMLVKIGGWKSKSEKINKRVGLGATRIEYLDGNI